MSVLRFAQMEVEIYGASHADRIGVRCQGLPSGEAVDLATLQAFLDRRAPGNSPLATSRKEPDRPVIESGLQEGVTDGTLFHAYIQNTSQRSGDYDKLRTVPRPSHGDYPAMMRSHFTEDLRGGGKYSGRLTAPLCILGGVAKQILARRGIRICAHAVQVGSVKDLPFDPLHPQIQMAQLEKSPLVPVLSKEAYAEMEQVILEAKSKGDSVGGAIECAVTGLPVGLGDHPFAGAENILTQTVFAVPGVKGIVFGDGFAFAEGYGSTHNDGYRMEKGEVSVLSNHCGGVVGGMTTGAPLLFTCPVKPTPSIALPQPSVDLKTKENVTLQIQGRHDPCIVLRAVPAIEAACAVAILALMQSETGELLN